MLLFRIQKTMHLEKKIDKKKSEYITGFMKLKRFSKKEKTVT